MIERETLIRTIAANLPKRIAARLIFVIENHYFPRLASPRTYNEHALKTKLFPSALVCLLADKLETKQYAIHLLGEEFVPANFFVGTSFSPKDFEQLPPRFAFKANHGWGYTKIVAEKKETSFAELYSLSRKWLSEDYSSTRNLELQYRDIQRKVYAEELVSHDGDAADDFKFHVFRNSPDSPNQIFVEVHTERFSRHKATFFDRNWKPLDISVSGAARTDGIPVPTSFKKMIEIADLLSMPFPYCRVDLFEFQGRPFVGEMTFSPSGGHEKFAPRAIDNDWGELIPTDQSMFPQ